MTNQAQEKKCEYCGEVGPERGYLVHLATEHAPIVKEAKWVETQMDFFAEVGDLQGAKKAVALLAEKLEEMDD